VLEIAPDPMYVDRTYYLAPDGGMAGDAFAVMRDGIQGKVCIGKLALCGREYLVAVRPFQRASSCTGCITPPRCVGSMRSTS
jgi:non-homologous end joining protein Ku